MVAEFHAKDKGRKACWRWWGFHVYFMRYEISGSFQTRYKLTMTQFECEFFVLHEAGVNAEKMVIKSSLA